MKKGIHPPYQEVLFIDSSTDYKFVCGSTLQPKEMATFEGKDYPVCRVSVSSSSHPVYTGAAQFVDTEGRIDKFRKRYQRGGGSKGKEESKKDKEQAPQEQE